MMPHCLVNGCRNGAERTDGPDTFHPFPDQPAAAERWAGLCGVSGPDRAQLVQVVERGSSGTYHLCSRHFEDSAFEGDAVGSLRNDERRLQQGAEPTLFLSNPPERQDEGLEHKAQVDGSLPAPRPQDSQINRSAASCSSCTFTRSISQTSRTSQVPDPEKSADPGPNVPPCAPETTVLHPQPGVSQIVLNIRERNSVLTLDNVPSESEPQCHEGGHSVQRVVKQIVLIFLDHPCESAKQASPGSSQVPLITVSSRTKTEGTMELGGYDHPPSVPSTSHHGPVQSLGSRTKTEGNRKLGGSDHPPSVPSTSHHEPVQTLGSSTQTEGTREHGGSDHPLCVPSISRHEPVQTLGSSTQTEGTREHGGSDHPLCIPSISRHEPVKTLGSSTQTEGTREHGGSDHPLCVPSISRHEPVKTLGSSTQTEGTREHDGSDHPLCVPSISCQDSIQTLSLTTQTEGTKNNGGSDHPLCVPSPSCHEPVQTLSLTTQTEGTKNNGESDHPLCVPSPSCHEPVQTLSLTTQTEGTKNNGGSDHPLCVPSPSCQDSIQTLSLTTQTEGTKKHGSSDHPLCVPSPSCQDSIQTLSSNTQTEIIGEPGVSQHPPSVPSTSCHEPIQTLGSTTQTECTLRHERLYHSPAHPDTQSPPDTHQEPAETLSSSTETDGTRRCVEVSYPPPNLEIQTSSQLMNAERTDCSITPNEGTDSPGKLIHSPSDSLTHKPSEPEKQTSLSCPEPMQNISSSTQTEVTRRYVDLNHHPPKSFQSSGTQTERPGGFPHDSGEGIWHRSRMEPVLTVDSSTQTQLTDRHLPGQLRKCEMGSESPSSAPLYSHNRPCCGGSCLGLSLNQYVGDLLEKHKASLQDSVLHPCPPPSSSSQCPCAPVPPRVRQIVLNFLEQESEPVSQDVPRLATSSDVSSPALTAHQETQTCEELLQQPPKRPKQKADIPQCHLPRPSQSRSCPPLLNGCLTSTSSQQEESRLLTPLNNDLGSILEPQLSCDTLKSKVTFDDIAIYFSKEEWELLGTDERGLYREVMSDNYQSLISLGFLLEKPELVSRIEREEEDLWEDRGTTRRLSHQAEDVCFLDLMTDGAHFLAKDMGTPASTGRESAESSSHLGALMRLVNEIPGFLLGSSVTDGSSSPARSLEYPETIRACSEVKTEESSPACTPSSVHALRLRETPDITANPGVPRITEESYSRVAAKVEEAEVAVNQSSGNCTPIISPLCIKRDPGTSTECAQGELRIKQEACSAGSSPAHSFIGQQREVSPVKPRTAHLPRNHPCGPRTHDPHTLDPGKRPCSRGGTSAPLNRSLGTSPRNPSVSPASLSDGTNGTGLGELKIKIKQEDSGSERDSAESPVCSRKVCNVPASSPSTGGQPEREHWRPRSSPRKSPADNIPPGNSHLHRLVNCLKEITASRPRGYSHALSPMRWGIDMNRIYSEAPLRATGPLGPRGPEIPATQPNPFTVAVTNGAARLKSTETKTAESRSVRPSRDETHPSNVPLSALGKCLDRITTRVSSGQHMGSGGSQRSEDPRRPELGVKRTHSDDLSRLPGIMSGAKRPTLEASSYSRASSSSSPGHRDLWRPPEELQRPPSVDQPIGKSHLMSVMDCVRKIPSCRPSAPTRGPPMGPGGAEPALSRTCTQSTSTERKHIEVKEEQSPSLPATGQWIQPTHSPGCPEQPGSSATNVHLTGLMRLMEEIPCAESTTSSRAMYSIAVGQSVARRSDRANYLSYCNDDGSFHTELNDNTIASVDSVFSDDTSWSSENVDPSYSAIGGLQRVVSEFAELGSVSPLVAVSTSIQEGNGLKKPKEPVPVSRLSEGVRRSPREAPVRAASACSAENGEVAYAALCGLQKVVHGFVEQECVSPISAVRNNPPSSILRDFAVKKTTYQEEEAESPHLQGSSPAPTTRFLCDNGNWLSETDSSYSALSGLQKVVNGFSGMSCVSPFSAVSTTASESTAEISSLKKSDPPAQDSSFSTLSGLRKVVNGVPDTGCMSPLTVPSYPSSEGEPDAGVKRRCDRDNVSWKYSADRQSGVSKIASTHDDPGHFHSSYSSPRKITGSNSHCIDLTQEEEPLCSKSRTASLDRQRKQKIREELTSNQPANLLGNRTSLPPSRVSRDQFIDLTEEEETPIKPKVLSSEVAGKSSHSDSPQKSAEKKHRPRVDLQKVQRVGVDKPLDPGPSGPNRGGVPVVNEHLSGLEKLLKGVPTFTPTNNPGGQSWSGGWWFKSTSPHET